MSLLEPAYPVFYIVFPAFNPPVLKACVTVVPPAFPKRFFAAREDLFLKIKRYIPKQRRLVPFYLEYVVCPSAYDFPGDLFLRAHGVYRDRTPFQAQHVQELGETV